MAWPQRPSTGRYEPFGSGPDRYEAFVPDPLPPADPPLEIGPVLSQLAERATHALGRLEGAAALLPDIELLIYSYVRREAVLSSQIEGTQSSLSDLLLFELEEAPGVPLADVRETSNAVDALLYGIDQVGERGLPTSVRLMKGMQKRVTHGTRGGSLRPGEFRNGQVWLGGPTPAAALFVPPPANEVPDAIAELERFIHTDESLSPLIQIGLTHVQFETIHPFFDGNGRVGRMLITVMLYEAKLLSAPLLYLSLYFHRHRSDYYDHLSRVRTHGEWERWLGFFLRGVAEVAEDAASTAASLSKLIAADRLRVEALGRGGTTPLRVHRMASERVLLTAGETARALGVTLPTAGKAIDKLVELGILEEITGRRRNRVFAYSDYLDILNGYH